MDSAVVEGDTGTNPLSRLRRQLVPLFVAYRRHLPPAGGSLSKGEPLAEPASFVHTGQRQKKPTDKPINFSPLPKPPPSGEVARQSRDGEGCFRGEPSQFRCARQLSRRGEPLAEPASFVHTGQRQKKSADKPINFSPLPKPPPSGEVARRSRAGEGFSPPCCRFRESLFQIGAGAKSEKASIPPRKKSLDYCPGIFVVDGIGLEPMTSCTSSRCSTS